MHCSLPRVGLSELEVQLRAQIEHVLGAGLKPIHLDRHALRMRGRDDVADLLVRLAKEYGLALRVNDKRRPAARIGLLALIALISCLTPTV